MALCIECNTRNGHEILGGSCTRCARAGKLFQLRNIADEHEKAWSDYCDIIYRVEVFEGDRVPPSSVGRGGTSPVPLPSDYDRPTHDVQGDPAMGNVANNDVGFSSPMKQVRRSNTATRTSAPALSPQAMSDEE